jgi:hypothetical protein
MSDVGTDPAGHRRARRLSQSDPLYRSLGFEVEVVASQRKAQAVLKRRIPDVIVAEYNFQSDFAIAPAISRP